MINNVRAGVTSLRSRTSCLIISALLPACMALGGQSSQTTLAHRPTEIADHLLGVGDQITIQGLDIEEFSNKPIRVDGSGDINLPMLGRINAAGRSVRSLETELNRSLEKYIKHPQVSIAVTELQSQPVSVLGAVNNPGVHQLLPGQRLVEVLSTAGGLRQDAGYTLKITRRLQWGPLPLPTAATDATGQFSVAEVSLKALMEARRPEENIAIMPQDVVTVPRAQMVYVIGEVKKSGGFVLGERETVSVLQALALAEGLDRNASPNNAKILRVAKESSERKEIAVDVKQILSGKSEDLRLLGDDILFIPTSTGKKAFLRAVETAIQTGSGVVIWRSAHY